MKTEEWDQVEEVRTKIEVAVKALVDDMTNDLPENIDRAIRLKLTENFRFWRS